MIERCEGCGLAYDDTSTMGVVVEYEHRLPGLLVDHLSQYAVRELDIGPTTKHEQSTYAAIRAVIDTELRRMFEEGELYEHPDPRRGWVWEVEFSPDPQRKSGDREVPVRDLHSENETIEN